MQESVERSWGRYTVIHDGVEFKTKRLEFDVGKPLSLQKHFNREELWLFVRGSGLMTVTEDQCLAWRLPTKVKQGDFIWIGKERWHSFVAYEPTEVFEVQLGRCEEDDIFRAPQPEWVPKI